MKKLSLQQQAVALWWEAFLKTNNTVFAPLLFDRHRYLVLMGGGGSGKSIFAGRKLLERASSESGHRFLVCRKVDKSIELSCFSQLVSQARQYYSQALARVQKVPRCLQFKNGSEIVFSGLDDVEKLKSIAGITGIWIEEASEITEADFNQLDIRLRDQSPYYKQIILSFNPIHTQHWLKKRFFDQKDPRALTSRTTYRDNRFLSQDAIQTLENFRQTDSYFYRVYALGEWGVTGKSVFDGQAVEMQLEKQIQPLHRGSFSYTYDGLHVRDITPVWENGGPLCIYLLPQEGVPYVIGVDTAGEGSDRFCAQVLDNRTGAQAAVLVQTTDEDLFARELYCLGTYYNHALIGIEVNFSTYPVRELQRLRYPKQYVRESMDDYTHAVQRAYGFRTDTKTRPVMIANLVKNFREHPELVADHETLTEMLSFVRDENLRPAAENGAHDDRVMALAIAHMIRPQQGNTCVQPQRVVHWRADQWQDYRQASPTQREQLLARWGKPRMD